MKTLPLCALLSLGTVALGAVALGAATLQDPPAPAQPLEQHQWLQQLVGEWAGTSEAKMEPGAEPMRMEFTETVRSVGGLWILAEGRFDVGGQPMHGVLSLGYDPAKKHFVGTWLDSMQTHLWVYRGSLDDAKKVLTLETEGPAFDDATKMAKYRETIELPGDGKRSFTSSVQGADGAWTTFMRAEYRRKAKKEAAK